jgi:hypothetical protein
MTTRPSPSGSRTDARAAADHLAAQYDQELPRDPRAAAETAYALAFRYRDHDIDGERRFDLAGEWALRAIALLDSLPSDSIDDLVSTRPTVGGVPIPELLHAQVVRERLGDVLV